MDYLKDDVLVGIRDNIKICGLITAVCLVMASITTGWVLLLSSAISLTAFIFAIINSGHYRVAKEFVKNSYNKIRSVKARESESFGGVTIDNSMLCMKFGINRKITENISIMAECKYTKSMGCVFSSSGWSVSKCNIIFNNKDVDMLYDTVGIKEIESGLEVIDYVDFNNMDKETGDVVSKFLGASDNLRKLYSILSTKSDVSVVFSTASKSHQTILSSEEKEYFLKSLEKLSNLKVCF